MEREQPDAGVEKNVLKKRKKRNENKCKNSRDLQRKKTLDEKEMFEIINKQLLLLRSRDDVIAQMREDERVHMVTVSNAMEAKEAEKAALVQMRNEAQNQLNW